MKRRVLIILAILLMITGIFILVRIIASAVAPAGKGALQVTTNVKASVFLDNKPLGNTPLCKCNPNETINEGVHDLKIVPEDTSLSPFSAKVDINKGVLTAVERTFLPGALSSAYILTLEKASGSDPEIFIASVPDGAIVTIDGESKGATPYTQNSISASEHEVEIEKSGFSKKTIRVRAVNSYKLVLNVLLGTQAGADDEQPKETPTPSTTTSPTPEVTKATEQSVKILDTPNGFLRVRSGPSTSSGEVGRVSDGETFPLIEESGSWYKISTDDGEGWVSSSYAEIVNE